MSQTEKLYNLLKSGEPANTDMIIREVYPNEGRLKTPARISARVWDVKHKYGVEIISYPDKEIDGLWWYKIEPRLPECTRNDETPKTNKIYLDELNQPVLFELPPLKQECKIWD